MANKPSSSGDIRKCNLELARKAAAREQRRGLAQSLLQIGARHYSRAEQMDIFRSCGVPIHMNAPE